MDFDNDADFQFWMDINDMVSRLERDDPSLTHLSELTDSNHPKKTDAWLAVLNALRCNTHVKCLEWGATDVVESTFRLLCEVVELNQGLEELRIVGVEHLATEHIAQLTQSLAMNSYIRLLDLSRNRLTGESAHHLACLLEKNVTLEELRLGDNNLQDFGVVAICMALMQNQSLQKLDMTQNNINEQGFNALASVLRENKVLNSLSVAGNACGNEGSIGISHALLENNTLQTLDLTSNNISTMGANMLAKVIRQNRSLTTLKLGFNHLGDEGIRAIANAFPFNTKLRFLDLPLVKISTKGGMFIITALEFNSTLQSIPLFWNTEVPLNVTEQIRDIVNENRCGYRAELVRKNLLQREIHKLWEPLVHHKNLSSALWPTIIAQTSSRDPTILFYLSKQEPLHTIVTTNSSHYG